jgi:hypothetical protein
MKDENTREIIFCLILKPFLLVRYRLVAEAGKIRLQELLLLPYPEPLIFLSYLITTSPSYLPCIAILDFEGHQITSRKLK